MNANELFHLVVYMFFWWFRDKFSLAFGSLFEHAKFEDGETLHLHFVCDDAGRNFAQDYLQKHVAHPTFDFKVSDFISCTFSL